jgi:hypothetical protein
MIKVDKKKNVAEPNSFNLAVRAFNLYALALDVEERRDELSNQIFYPHEARKHNEPSASDDPKGKRGKGSSQLEVKQEHLLPRASEFDYRMRKIAVDMHKLEQDIKICIEADDERKMKKDED